MRRRGEHGFSLVEMLVAAAILSATFIVFFQLAASGQRVARAQPDAADMQQRLRIAADTIRRELIDAGAGGVHGDAARPLVDALPPVVPQRLGARSADPELSFFTDRITVLHVVEGGPAVALSVGMASPGDDVPLTGAEPGCVPSARCGFEDGTRAALFDVTAAGMGFELFSVTGVASGLAHGPPNPPFSRSYPAGSRIAQIRQRTFYLDAATRRLMSYDGYQTDVPIAENIVSLQFEYLVDPSPGAAPRPVDGTGNCAYAPGSPPLPLLADLGPPVLARASARLFTDGPLCGLAPNRFDADLLRIRRVRVTIRAQTEDASVRGRGAEFANAGRSTGAESLVPDLQATFDVTPRSLEPSR